MTNAGRREALTLRQASLICGTCIVICWGLGYATLNRYDPRQIGGTSDSSHYYQLVVGGPSDLEHHRSYRVLVPAIAKPFYWLAKGRLNSWNAVFFGLLVANSLFCALTATLLCAIGRRLGMNLATSILAATLFLLNFQITNSQLAGMSDSGECFLLLVLVWLLLTDRYSWLPLSGILGAMAKETFVPLGLVLTSAWLLVDRAGQSKRWQKVVSIVVMCGTGLLTVSTLRWLFSGWWMWPWNLANSFNRAENYIAALFHSLTAPSFWYAFVWLLPLGLWRLRHFPVAWVAAGFLSALAALMLGAYAQAEGNSARAVFNLLGPLLSLSTAIYLADLSVDRNTPDSEH